MEGCLRGCEGVFVAVFLEEGGEFDGGWEAIEARMCISLAGCFEGEFLKIVCLPVFCTRAGVGARHRYRFGRR